MMSNLEFRLSDMEFMQPCQYYLSLQLDENKKRLRTKVSAETKHPVFCLLYTFRAHETRGNLVCRLLLEKKK